MARLPRLIVDGLPHVVSQRVQHQQTLARDTEDRVALLERLRTSAPEHGVAVHAYAVLDDRFDLVVTPGHAEGLSRFMQAVARRHSADFNRRHGRAGGLWAGRYRVAVVEPESWLLTCMRYVEQSARLALPAGPAFAPPDGADGLTSQGHHTGARVEPWLADPAPYWALGNTPFDRHAAYRALASRALPEEQVMRIEAAMRGGWALGRSEFFSELSSRSARPTSPRPPGRPLKSRGGV